MIARVLALAGTLCAAAPAAAQQAVTKAEVRSQKPPVTDAQLRNQLWGMFREQDRRGDWKPVRPLETERMETRAYPTSVPGLCRADVVVMLLAPVRGAGREADADTPMRAYGLEASKRFLLLDLPPDQRGDRFADKWHGPCSRLAQDDPRFFQAEDEEAAERGYRALQRAVRAVSAGEVKLECNLGTLAKQGCTEVLAAFAKRPIARIDACPAGPGLSCYQIFSDDLQVRVSVATASGIPSSVEIEQLILLWHPRPD